MQRNGKRWISVSVVGTFAAAMVLGGLGGCGQKGPLTLPGSSPAGAAPASAPASGAPASPSR